MYASALGTVSQPICQRAESTCRRLPTPAVQKRAGPPTRLLQGASTWQQWYRQRSCSRHSNTKGVPQLRDAFAICIRLRPDKHEFVRLNFLNDFRRTRLRCTFARILVEDLFTQA